MGLKRTAQLPNVPTVDESGIKGYESTGWYGLYGPRGMPRPIVDKLYAAVRQMVQSQDVLDRFTALNLTVVGSTPEEFAKFLKEDYARYVEVAKAANIQPQ
jgi:tripartite-type tricarboxylate transporter receptor subunit TctC